jgi:hypothetical protein
MTDITFNGKVRRTNLYRFRRQGALGEEFIAARDLATASALLHELGIDVDQLERLGTLVTPLRTDVE